MLRIKSAYTLSTIECDFVYVDLHSAGDYAALSYTWGTIAPSTLILVDKRVPLITENLYLALLHLRQRQATMLWVDALCIYSNRSSIKDRGNQPSFIQYQRSPIKRLRAREIFCPGTNVTFLITEITTYLYCFYTKVLIRQ